ncbi:MAG TPA: hypothetical protein GX512_08140 [Firmicutes bacterium]|nr:hypothetical protein [Candidatus Fermentithermobacillaceae bacterium]
MRQLIELCALFSMLLIAVIYGRDYSRTGTMPIRRLPALDSVDEAVGRTTEMGRPVHFTTGTGGMVADTFAAFAVLEYLAKKTAQYECALIVSNADPVVHPITENIVRAAYHAQGKPESFKPSNIRYHSDSMLAYVSGVWGIMEREKVAANIMMGYFFAESLLLSEGGVRTGAFQIAGTASTPQLPFLVAACDQTLIGEELFAAGAYLTEDPVRIGALMAQDTAKIASIGVILLGALAATVVSQI